MYQEDSFLFKNSIEKLLISLSNKSEKFWIEKGEKMALLLFHSMADRVPAYKDFLKRNKCDPSKIRTINDFEKVPLLNKDNYLRHYTLNDLCWDGNLHSASHVYSTTSGTTGKPFYFPRTDLQDRMYSLLAELYLVTNFNIDKKKTLYIDAFAMGPWIGGLFTYQALKNVIDTKKYSIGLITTGVNIDEIIKAVQNLGGFYDQILIGGYPPFIKDTIDKGIVQGVDWKKYKLGFIFSAEAFTEKFRDYIIEKTGMENEYKDTLNHYGTVDQGTLAYETPLSIFARRFIVKNDALSHIFLETSNQLPTLAQYIPEQFYFEEINNSLICSSYSGIPLVRYDIQDRGGIITKNTLENKLLKIDNKFIKDLNHSDIKDTIWNLPFVYVYEREDMVVSMYGSNIYPEHIREAYLDSEVNQFVTGKFTMKVILNDKQDPKLYIYTELRDEVKKTNKLKNALESVILRVFLEKNSEFKNNYNIMPDKMMPEVNLLSHKTGPYFNVKGKHKWKV